MFDDENKGDGTPIDRFLKRLKGVKRSGPGWIAFCPAHDDKSRSLGIDLVNGVVMHRCHAGCSFEAVCSAVRLSPRDMYPRETSLSLVKGGKTRQKLDLEEFCKHKQLPVDFVTALGWHDDRWHGSPAVFIPYPRRDGTIHRSRVRVALSAKEGSRWSEGSSLIAYEPDHGETARKAEYLIVVEGETDTATLLLAGFPALGIPGATATHVLEREHLDGVKMVYVVQEPDAAGKTFVGLILSRVQELGFTGPMFALPMPNAAKDPSALYQRDPGQFPELLYAAMVEAAKPPPEPLDDVWKTLGEWGSLVNAPPPRRWLLERPDDECNGARQIGVLPLGKVGMLVSAGGVGKTMALVELALAVATGRKWLDHFGVANPGRVLLALGEEDQEEIGRRVYQAAHAMRLTQAQIELAAQNIVAMPLAGRPVALVANDNGATAGTELLSALRKRLDAGTDWRLIILDPLSRFAGVDTEKDNSAATRFVETAESLVRSPGGPSVLIAHHTNKTSRTDGSSVNAAHARGATGLTDGVRWVANLESAGPDTVHLEVTKSNYAPYGPPVTLYRDSDYGGFLRVQTSAEQTARLEKASEKGRARMQTLRELVIKTVAENPGLKTFQALLGVTKGKRNDLHAAFHELVTEGWIEKSKEGFKLTERSGLDG